MIHPRARHGGQRSRRRAPLAVPVAILAAALGLLAGPVLAGPASAPVLAHSELVSSTPGAGEVVAVSPSELRLVFSEPLAPGLSSLDLLDEQGAAILRGAGLPDPSDPRILVATVPTLATGRYTISWRALSAADGHSTSGFIPFGVGDVPPPESAGGSANNIHIHGGELIVIDLQARAAFYLGMILAFGLAIIASAVVRPVTGTTSVGLVRGIVAALLAVAVGGALLSWTNASAAIIDPIAYLSSGPAGYLLAATIVLGAAAAALAAGLLATGRPAAVVTVGAVAGLVAIVMTAAGGHAAAIGPWAIAAISVHLASAGVWAAGVVALALSVGARSGASPRQLVPRFSALALVAIALLAATGAASSWALTGWVLDLGDAYTQQLLLKIGIAVVALVIGGLNYVDGGRGRGWLGGFGRRVGVEALLAVGVVFVTASLVTGVPPQPSRPIPLEPVAALSATATTPSVTVAIAPGRAGPNALVTTVTPAAPAGSTAEVRLDRLDTTAGETRVPMVATGGNGGSSTFRADVGTLPDGSRWEATTVVADAGGTEVGRGTVRFGLTVDGLSEGVATPPLDPIALFGILVAAAGVLGLGYAIGGGVLPRTEPVTSRLALIGGSLTGIVLGGILVLAPLVT